MSKAKDAGKTEQRKKAKEPRKSKREEEGWADLYCANCGHFIMKYYLVWGGFEVPCRFCRNRTTVELKPGTKQ